MATAKDPNTQQEEKTTKITEYAMEMDEGVATHPNTMGIDPKTKYGKPINSSKYRWIKNPFDVIKNYIKTEYDKFEITDIQLNMLSIFIRLLLANKYIDGIYKYNKSYAFSGSISTKATYKGFRAITSIKIYLYKIDGPEGLFQISSFYIQLFNKKYDSINYYKHDVCIYSQFICPPLGHNCVFNSDNHPFYISTECTFYNFNLYGIPQFKQILDIGKYGIIMLCMYMNRLRKNNQSFLPPEIIIHINSFYIYICGFQFMEKDDDIVDIYANIKKKIS